VVCLFANVSMGSRIKCQAVDIVHIFIACTMGYRKFVCSDWWF